MLRPEGEVGVEGWEEEVEGGWEEGREEEGREEEGLEERGREEECVLALLMEHRAAIVEPPPGPAAWLPSLPPEGAPGPESPAGSQPDGPPALQQEEAEWEQPVVAPGAPFPHPGLLGWRWEGAPQGPGRGVLALGRLPAPAARGRGARIQRLGRRRRMMEFADSSSSSEISDYEVRMAGGEATYLLLSGG
jgi:hypothetical protein